MATIGTVQNCKKCGESMTLKRGFRHPRWVHNHGGLCSARHGSGTNGSSLSEGAKAYGFHDEGEYRMSGEYAAEMRAQANAFYERGMD